MYLLKYKGKIWTIPKNNIYPFALYRAMSLGVMHGKIGDEKSAIKYLESTGFEITSSQKNSRFSLEHQESEVK